MINYKEKRIPDHKLQQADNEVWIEKKGQNKDEATKQDTKQTQGKKGWKINQAQFEYQTNFPKRSSNYTRYEPNTQVDKNTKHGNNGSQVFARNNQ